METDEQKPTLRIAAALGEILRSNARTWGKGVGKMYLGADVFIVRLTRPQIVNGQCWETDRTIDIQDLWNLEEP